MKPEHNPSLPSVVGKEQARWQPMELHGARLALWQAIRSIKIGNNTDDKLILEELRK